MGFKKVGKPIRSGKLQNSNSRKMKRGGGTRSVDLNHTIPINPETGREWQYGEWVTVDPGGEIPPDSREPNVCPTCATLATYCGSYGIPGYSTYCCQCRDMCPPYCGCGGGSTCAGYNQGCCAGECSEPSGACLNWNWVVEPGSCSA